MKNFGKIEFRKPKSHYLSTDLKKVCLEEHPWVHPPGWGHNPQAPRTLRHYVVVRQGYLESQSVTQ